MKILFLTDNFPPEVNAPASRTYEHCRHWVEQGNEVTVITCAPNFPNGTVYEGYKNKIWQKETMDGITVIRVWSFITSNSGFLLRTLDYISYMVSAVLFSPLYGKYDVVIGTSPQFFTVVAAYVISVLKRIPFIFELRDLWPESIKTVGAMKNGLAIKFLEKLEMFLYRKAKLIISVTQSFKEILIERGIEEGKIAVITNGVDLSRFQPMPKDQDLVVKYGLEKKFVAGYIGTIGMAHALEIMIYAAERFKNEYPQENVVFVILGSGSNKELLQEKALKLQLSNLLFIDSVPKDEVVRFWSILDAVVIHLKKDPLFKTVIPSKLFESMGMGCPVLYGVEGESAEIVRDSNVGILFESENVEQLCDAILKLKSDKESYKFFKLNAENSAHRFERNNLASQLFTELEKVTI